VASARNAFVDESIARREANRHFSRSYGTPPLTSAFGQLGGVGEMNEGAELAPVGLVLPFAAVLLVASQLFIQSQSAKQHVKGSIDLKITTNTIASWL
jgi:hypothetical protein